MKKIIANIYEAGEFAEPADPAFSGDLHRIAKALERIATTLEKLTGEKGNIPVEAKGSLIKAEEPVNNGLKPLVQHAATSMTDVLEDYLEQKGIKIKPFGEKPTPDEQARRDKLNLLALFLGNNLKECMGLYQWLKSKLSSKNINLTYLFKEADSENREKITNFCNYLKKAGLLKSFSFQVLPENSIKLEFTGKDSSFLKGTWLERFVEQKVRRLLKDAVTKGALQQYQIRSNLKLSFKDNTEGELDLFFAVGKKVFCIEVKTYPSSKDLKDVINKLKPLGINDRNILIVTAEKSSEQCLKLTEVLDGVRVVGLANFEETLKTMIMSAS